MFGGFLFTENFFVDIINMTYRCRVVLDMICMESGIMKTDRLIGILSILLQEEKTTAPELAEKFEVSRRTINRDIEDLCKAGIPIRTAQGTGGGISIMDGYCIDRTILTSKDMQMILAGLRSLDSVSGSRYYSQLMEKIQTGSSEFISGRDSMLIDLSSWYKGSLAPKIEVIQSAIENRRIIRFKYYAPSGESNRRVEPYYLVFRWSSWYVSGIDYARKEDFKWISVIRLPDFVTMEDFDWAVRKATAKKKQDFSKVEFFSYEEGLCVQCMLDKDLAEIYGYEVKKLNQQVKRNIERFPEDFMFRLSNSEIDSVRSQIVTSRKKDFFAGQEGGRRYLPYAFTEQGIYMLATVLRGKLAEQQSIFIMRTFRECVTVLGRISSLLPEMKWIF